MPTVNTEEIRTSDLCHILGITDRRLRQLVQDGLPKRGRGVFDLAEVVQWYTNRLLTRGADKSLDEQRKELLFEQTLKTRLDNEILRRDLIATSEALSVFGAAQVIIASMLDAFGRRMAVVLAGIDNENEIESVLFEECREIRRAFADKLAEIGEVVDGGGQDADAAPAKDGKPVRRRRKNPAARKSRARALAK